MKSQTVYGSNSPYESIRTPGDYRPENYLPKQRKPGDYRGSYKKVTNGKAVKGTAAHKKSKGISINAKKLAATIGIFAAISGSLLVAHQPHTISTSETKKTQLQQIDEQDYLTIHPEIIQTQEMMETILQLDSKDPLNLSTEEQNTLTSAKTGISLEKVIQYSDYITRSQIAKAVNPKLGFVDIEDIKLGPNNIFIDQGDKSTTITEYDYAVSKLLKNSYSSDNTLDNLKKIYMEAKSYDNSGYNDIIAYSRLSTGNKIELAKTTRTQTKTSPENEKATIER